MKEKKTGVRKTTTVITVADAFLRLVGVLSMWITHLIVRALVYTVQWYRIHTVRFVVDILIVFVFVAIYQVGSSMYHAHLTAQVTTWTIKQIDVAIPRESKRNFIATEYKFNRAGAPEWLRKHAIKIVLTEARKARLTRVETALVLAVINPESRFNPLAKANGTSACGLAQYIQETGARYGVSQQTCLDPAQNVRAQIKHLRALEHKTDIAKLLRTAKDDTGRLVMLYQALYCKHHDGNNARACSTTAKVVVADGIRFFLEVYDILREADQRMRQYRFEHMVYTTLVTMTTTVTSHATDVFVAATELLRG